MFNLTSNFARGLIIGTLKSILLIFLTVPVRVNGPIMEDHTRNSYTDLVSYQQEITKEFSSDIVCIFDIIYVILIIIILHLIKY